MVVRSSCISPVNTVPHGGRIIVHSTCQHSIIGGQIIVHSTSQPCSTWWSYGAFHQSAQYHMVVRSPCNPLINTVPHIGQIITQSNSQHSTTWWSDRKLVMKETEHRAWNSQYSVEARVQTKKKLLFNFFNPIVPMEFLPWEIQVSFPGETRATQPKMHAGCCSFSIIHRTLTQTRGCTETWLGQKKSLAAQGSQTCLSCVPVRRSADWAVRLFQPQQTSQQRQ